MAICAKCGSYVPDNAVICTVCGRRRTPTQRTGGTQSAQKPARPSQTGGYDENYNQGSYKANYTQNDSGTSNAQSGYNSNYAQNGYNAAQRRNFDQFNQYPYSEQAPSVFWYIIMTLVFNIPVIGFICAIVMAFGTPGNRAKRNFALAHLILLVIGIVLIIIFWAVIISAINRIPPRYWWEYGVYGEGVTAFINAVRAAL